MGFYASWGPRFDSIYARSVRSSIPPEMLLRPLLLRVLYMAHMERGPDCQGCGPREGSKRRISRLVHRVDAPARDFQKLRGNLLSLSDLRGSRVRPIIDY